MLPAIRYPLPTLLVAVVAALGAWFAEPLTRPFRARMAGQLQTTIHGPEYPRSTSPKVREGGIFRKGLLLSENVDAYERPGGRLAETIHYRMFVDVYDFWPMEGEPDFIRVGNRRPLGWIKHADLLLWDTRLVIHVPPGTELFEENGKSTGVRWEGQRNESLPVLEWNDKRVKLAVWAEKRAWQSVKSVAWVRLDDLTAESWGAWLSREELLELVRRAIASDAAEPPSSLRLRALLGRLSDSRSVDNVPANALPRTAFVGSKPTLDESSDGLAVVNEHWSPEASWSGLSFQFVSVTKLP